MFQTELKFIWFLENLYFPVPVISKGVFLTFRPFSVFRRTIMSNFSNI